jgi:integrase
MNTLATALSMPESLPYQLDHDAWVRHLRGTMPPDGEWRPQEFDPDGWLFTGDPDNPATTSTRCKVRACAAIVTSRCLCRPCRRAWVRSELEEDAFVAAHQPALARHRSVGGGIRVNQFSLAALASTVRWEVLYALQQRDRQGLKIDPVALRRLTASLTDVDTLTSTSYPDLRQRIGRTRSVHAYARMLTQVLHLAFEEFRGIRHTDKDVWDCLALDLETPRPGRRPNLASIDFTPIRQRWLREATKEWVRTVRPTDTGEVKRTMKACTLASEALTRRPGGGEDPSALRYGDMEAVFQAIKTARGQAGSVYDARYRRALWARLHAVLDLGRKTELLAALPGAFSRHPSQTIGHEEANEDEIGKAIPETVIAQLDQNLDLLGTDRTYGRAWSTDATRRMFRTAYHVLRDTGRRPSEVVSLRVACLEFIDGAYTLVYDNHKKKRHRRRLPITSDTAASIQAWQTYRAGLDLPASTRAWLFPSWGDTTGRGHLTTNRLVRAITAWAQALPVLHSDTPGPNGTPLPFDRSLIVPSAFRHSYAQRHADAGVPVEVLSELMDHRTTDVTRHYYTVSLKRKREAIAIMSRYVHDRTGSLCSGPAARYELTSVAVPFGNCIEPANVKAGGQGCPIRFQCVGCGFYRPDPSYLPTIEDHIIALKADRETALAMDVDDFVVRNLADQANAFTTVATTMRDALSSLPEHERAEVEQASRVLRTVRAGRDLADGRRLLPLTITNQSTS